MSSFLCHVKEMDSLCVFTSRFFVGACRLSENVYFWIMTQWYTRSAICYLKPEKLDCFNLIHVIIRSCETAMNCLIILEHRLCLVKLAFWTLPSWCMNRLTTTTRTCVTGLILGNCITVNFFVLHCPKVNFNTKW